MSSMPTTSSTTPDTLYNPDPRRRLCFAPAFTDHMVLQREREVPVWGYAEPGSLVELHFGGSTHRGTADDDGRWVIRFNPGPANGVGAELAACVAAAGAAAPGRIVTLRDVLVGDVWLCAGQSNMELGLAACEGGGEDALQAHLPGVRLLLIAKTSAPVPIRSLAAAWKTCTPATVVEEGWGGFSAVAYYFGRRIHAETGVPVGLIQAAYGGSKIHPFIQPACLEGHPALERLNRELAEADQAWRRLLAERGVARPDGDSAAARALHPFAPFVEWDALKPASVWNAMLHPLLPFAVRGVLWYQGESDVGAADSYAAKMRALMLSFRHAFADPALPLYFAQVAPYSYGDATALLDLWLAQYEVAETPHSGLVTTVDVGDMADIHPLRKRPVGERFAALALAKTYGRTDLPGGGPQLREVAFHEGGADLSFTTFGGNGLWTLDGQPPTGFELAGTGGAFYPARAVIVGDQVVLTCPEVGMARRVQHAWQVGVTPNLSDASRIPALPFCHDGPASAAS